MDVTVLSEGRYRCLEISLANPRWESQVGGVPCAQNLGRQSGRTFRHSFPPRRVPHTTLFH